MNHPCPRYEPELSAYLDGELAAAPRAEVDTHLRACEPCRRALAQLRGVSKVLRRWDAHETRYATSTGFRNRVLERIGASESSPPSRWVVRVAAAAAFVAVGALGWAALAPRLLPDSSTEVASLRDEVRRMARQLDANRTATPIPMPAPAANDVAVERLDPLGTVVARPSADDAPSSPASAADAPDVWDQHGDGRILRDAWPDHDAFERERLALGLDEVHRRLEERPSAPEHPTVGAAAPSPLADFLGQIHVAQGNFSSFDQIQVLPIESDSARAGDKSAFVTCDAAIAERVLSVSEGPSDGAVVAVNNDAKRSVLVLAGDVLFGGKQDRVAREDAIVVPGARISIPTYGSGRARKRTSYTAFTHSDGVATPEIRAMIAADRALVAGVDQARIDEAVARTVQALATPRDLGSLDNLFSNLEVTAKADRMVKTFEKRLSGSSVVGFAVAAGSEILGVEVFGDHATFASHRARVLRSYMMAALAASHLEGAAPSRDAIGALLADAGSAAFVEQAQSGGGKIACFRGVHAGAFGCGLLDGSHTVHAVLFTGIPRGIDAPVAHGGHRAGGEGNPMPSDSHDGGGSRGSDGDPGVEPK